eukprot:3440467-Prymnesium_polylepis.1
MWRVRAYAHAYCAMHRLKLGPSAVVQRGDGAGTPRTPGGEPPPPKPPPPKPLPPKPPTGAFAARLAAARARPFSCPASA